MITLSHVRKQYPSGTPLKDINAQIDKGEIISVIGPSGTGKSTLLRCINMIDPPTSGSIIVDGEEITAKGCKLNIVRRKMGMVFQSFNLFEHMNVLENITYAPIKLLGLSEEEANKKAIEILSLVSMSGKAQAYPDELSGGQKQRVAIARTLAMDPEIILFDEPTSALDPSMIAEVLSVIRTLAQRGMTMMIVTHELQFARDVSTRVFYMDQGEIYEDGTPEQIFENPQKELTRRFVRNLKILEKDIKSENFDLWQFNADIENFGRKHMMNQKTIYSAQAVLEELCVETILKNTDSLYFALEHSKKNGESEIKITYPGNPWNAMEGMDTISSDILKNAVESVCYAFDNDINTFTFKLAK